MRGKARTRSPAASTTSAAAFSRPPGPIGARPGAAGPWRVGAGDRNADLGVTSTAVNRDAGSAIGTDPSWMRARPVGRVGGPPPVRVTTRTRRFYQFPNPEAYCTQTAWT